MYENLSMQNLFIENPPICLFLQTENNTRLTNLTFIFYFTKFQMQTSELGEWKEREREREREREINRRKERDDRKTDFLYLGKI